MFDEAQFDGDISQWSIRLDADVEDMVGYYQLQKMPQPCVSYWARALGGKTDLIEQNPQALAHFHRFAPTCKALAMGTEAGALWLAKEWRCPSPAVEYLLLPDMDVKQGQP